MIEFMVMMVVSTIVLSLTYLVHSDPANPWLIWTLIGFIGSITLTGIYVLLAAIHERE